MNAGVIVILCLLGLSLLGIPIYLALGIGALVALNYAGMPLIVLPQKLFGGMNSASLLAIPLFILAGNIMSRTITSKLVQVSNALFGRRRGSLGVVTVAASALFGAISGSGVATASAIGGTMISAMKEDRYPDHFAAAISGMASCLGPIIPPSITLIVYANCVTDVSVSKLFIGSALPGILLAGALMIYCAVYGRRHNLPAHEKMSARQIARTFKEGIWALLMPVIILGGIFGGIFTASESAAVAVVYALFISFFLYRDMTLRDLYDVLVDSVLGSTTILMLMGLSKVTSYVVTTSGLPQKILALFQSITSSRLVLLLLLNLLFIVIGMLMEANAAIVMMTPLLLPILNVYGISTLTFGIMMSFNLCIGLVTPPVGMCLLMTNQIARADFKRTLKSALPLIGIGVAILLLITYVPFTTTWLPSLIS